MQLVDLRRAVGDTATRSNAMLAARAKGEAHRSCWVRSYPTSTGPTAEAHRKAWRTAGTIAATGAGIVGARHEQRVFTAVGAVAIRMERTSTMQLSEEQYGEAATGGKTDPVGAPPERTPGATGHVLPGVGLGLAAPSCPDEVNPGHVSDPGSGRDETATRRHARSTLDAALRQRLLNSDPARRCGQVESSLGRRFARRGTVVEKGVVGWKRECPYTADWRIGTALHEAKEFTLALLRRQRDASLDQLGSALRFDPVHAPALQRGQRQRADLVDGRARPQTHGVIVGSITTGAQQSEVIGRARAVRIDRAPLIRTAQALANGRPTARDNGSAFARTRAIRKSIGAHIGVGPKAMAIAAILTQPRRPLVLSGAATAAHLQARPWSVDIDLHRADAAALQGVAENPKPPYWRRQAALAWN